MPPVTPTQVILLETPLPPEECVRRLHRRIRSQRDIALWGRTAPDGRLLVGWATRDGFALRLRERWFRHNMTAARPVATGRFVPLDKGTRVEICLGPQRGALQSVRLVFGTGAFLLALLALASLAGTALAHGDLWWVLGGVCGIVLWQALDAWRGRRRVLAGRTRLVRTLAEIVEARVTGDP